MEFVDNSEELICFKNNEWIIKYIIDWDFVFLEKLEVFNKGNGLWKKLLAEFNFFLEKNKKIWIVLNSSKFFDFYEKVGWRKYNDLIYYFVPFSLNYELIKNKIKNRIEKFINYN